MSGLAQSLFRYTSAVDDVEQPFLVSAPSELPAGAILPVVFLLHDVLAEPSAEGFVEEAFRQAALWSSAMEECGPALLVQPFGRGNGGWLGLGARDFFDVWANIQDKFACDRSATYLVGIGAGATGSLQLASWFPGLFAAVASVGAWTDDRRSLPLGATDWPPWERAQRRAVSPLALARNLSSTPLYLEHPWWMQGVGSGAAHDHLDELLRSRGKAQAPTHVVETTTFHRDAPSDRDHLLRWLFGRGLAAPQEFRFKTYSLRAQPDAPVRVEGLARPGKPAIVRGRTRGEELRLKTRGVSSLLARLGHDGAAPNKLRIDKQSIPVVHALAEQKADSDGWLRLERLGEKWAIAEAADASFSVNQGAVKSPTLPGPAMDLRWENVVFVPGTLGDEADNLLALSIAEQMKRRWQSGADSIQSRPGDRSLAIEYAIVPDAQVTEEQLARCHTVAIGTPDTNLLMARFRSDLAIQWSDEGSQARSFTFNGKRYADPEDLLLALCPNPEFADRYLYVITANSPAALALGASLNTAYLPDYLVVRNRRVLDWGYAASDWRPTVL